MDLSIFARGATPGTSYSTDGTISGYQSTSPVVLNDANPKNLASPIYNAASQTLTETITEQNTSNTFSTTYSGVNLTSILGGSTAYVGFTGTTGPAELHATDQQFRLQRAGLSE